MGLFFGRKKHWEKVYGSKPPESVSWYQAEPMVSLRFIGTCGINTRAAVIDVGGGASILADKLLDKGYSDITVLDISQKAIDHAKERLGAENKKITWIVTDITDFEPAKMYDLWHDRAVFHFLTDAKDRVKYIECLKKALNPLGHLIIATFAAGGPEKCSGLKVERYDAAKMKNELGNEFELINTENETHKTPNKTEQKFSYFYFRRTPGLVARNP